MNISSDVANSAIENGYAASTFTSTEEDAMASTHSGLASQASSFSRISAKQPENETEKGTLTVPATDHKTEASTLDSTADNGQRQNQNPTLPG